MLKIRIFKEGVLMVLKYLSALFLPFLLVLLFTRVTYHRVIGLVLTVALIAASVYKGYTNSLGLIVVDAFSLTLGFWYAKKMTARTQRSA
jgi:general stress protein CsbA